MGTRMRWVSPLLFVLGACSPSEDHPTPEAPEHGTRPTQRPRPRPMDPGLQPAIQEIARGRFAEARERALAFGAAHPAEGQADFVVGLSHEKAGNYAAALEAFQASRAKAPADFILHDYLGRTLFLLGRLDEARVHFEAYARVDPLDPKSLYGLGTIELEESLLAEAEATFRRALELFEELNEVDPRMYRARGVERAECHARLGDVYFALDRYVEARDELETASRLAPENISVFHALSLVYRRLGDDRKADFAAQIYADRKRAMTANGEGSR